ncbi:hypothetical protein ATI61_109396 [Archangium gephyra]|uniref:Uncharacterized protein n=1 Tax=Archangium gephyra TaxID=48 RepID=A0AAC8TAZ9_9BACT|nr:hypothetical protein [Archangium gephyra]AKI99401.1 Hypothetical protein AA314_01028 [Archangium gephyra]REG28052.1 hypothetical protein ATI61_109396 [Archangium gephyra]
METTPHEPKHPRELVHVPVSVSDRKGLLDKSAAAGIPAMPLLGKLPLRRLIPQNLHSVLDYQGALTVAGVGLLSGPGAFRTASLVLGGSGLGVSLLTDYRLSLFKLIPIEVHEAIDYVWSLGVIAAPFLLGGARRSRWATWVNVLVGASTIVASLFTDYRAQRGVQWVQGQPTDLGPVGG